MFNTAVTLLEKTVLSLYRSPQMAPVSKVLIVRHLRPQSAVERVLMLRIMMTVSWIVKMSWSDCLYCRLRLKTFLVSLLDCCTFSLIQEIC